MLMKTVLFLALVPLAAPPGDSLYGKCKYQDGSKVDGKVTVSTSWNAKKVNVRNGSYRLDFGDKVDRTVAVYVNGKRYKLVLVRGNTHLDIVLPKPPIDPEK